VTPASRESQTEPARRDRSDLAACAAMLRAGSRSFFLASRLLPPRVRDGATALYAFCRSADDAVDDGAGDAAAVADLRDRLDRAYAGRPRPNPVDRAFAAAVGRAGIPKAIPDALVEGMAWDVEGRRYATLAEVNAYAARVAGTVGAMMALVMGVRDRDAVARACDLGVAMQLTNIARDVGEDAANGRLYLPRDWLAEDGLDPDAWLAAPRPHPAVRAATLRLLAVADALYQRAERGIDALPAACRPGIRAARHVYAEIGREVERLGDGAFARRAVVAPARKLALVRRAVTASVRAVPQRAEPPLEETRFLVEAVAAHPAPPDAREPASSRWWDVEGRTVWVLHLFERLERRDRQRAPAPVRLRRA